MSEKTPRKVVAVIGAGPSGLSAIKSCKEEGMEVICFEKTDSIGGLWHYRENNVEGVGSIMKSHVANFSKEMNAFSDFPPPVEAPNYMHHRTMMEYLTLYSEKFDLARHILFSEEVVQVAQDNNYEKTGRWVIRSRNVETSSMEINERTFDCVMICTGKRGYPKQPIFPGQDFFRGKLMHSKFVKNMSEFEDKSVLIIGFGNSAIQAAMDISIVAKHVYMSTRRGGWIVPKVGTRGLPSDTLYFRRHLHLLQKFSYTKVCDRIQKLLDTKVSHEDYKIKPDHDVLSKMPIISDDLPDKILSGRIIIKGELEQFEYDGVVFKDEKTITPLDVVIYATGYKTELPFLDHPVSSKALKLYKYVFPTDCQHPTFSIIGLTEPLGPSLPVAESQARWASLVFNEKLGIPSKEHMLKDIVEQMLKHQRRFGNSTKPQVDYIEYMDELATQCGCNLNLSLLCMKDFGLFWKCFSGPCLPYQYRICGPHQWNQAREAIETCHERISSPLNATKISQFQRPFANNVSFTYGAFLLFCLILII